MKIDCPTLKGFHFHKSGISMVRLCNVSNWSVFFRYYLVRLLTSQIGQSHSGASWYVSAISQFGQSLLDTSLYVFSTSQTGQIHLGLYSASDWLVSLSITWYVFFKSQIGQPHLATSSYVFVTSRFGQSHLGASWYIFSTSLKFLSLVIFL